MNTSAKIRYFLSLLGLFLLCILAFDLLFPPFANKTHLLSFRGIVKVLLAALLLTTFLRLYVILARLGYPAYETLLALTKASNRPESFVKTGKALLYKSCPEACDEHNTAAYLKKYRSSLPFCAFMAAPRTQWAFQSLLLFALICLVQLAGLPIIDNGPILLLIVLVALFFFGLCLLFRQGMDFPWPHWSDKAPAPLRPLGNSTRSLVSLDALLLLFGLVASFHAALREGAHWARIAPGDWLYILAPWLIALSACGWYGVARRGFGRFSYEELLDMIACEQQQKSAGHAGDSPCSVKTPEDGALQHPQKKPAVERRTRLRYYALIASPYARKGAYNILLSTLVHIIMRLHYPDNTVLQAALFILLLLGVYRVYRESRNIFGGTLFSYIQGFIR